MILESEDEKKAFEFVCELASSACDRICNDLEEKDQEKFKHLLVECYEDNEIIMTPVTMDYDVLAWLKKQAKEDFE